VLGALPVLGNNSFYLRRSDGWACRHRPLEVRPPAGKVSHGGHRPGAKDVLSRRFARPGDRWPMIEALERGGPRPSMRWCMSGSSTRGPRHQRRRGPPKRQAEQCADL